MKIQNSNEIDNTSGINLVKNANPDVIKKNTSSDLTIEPDFQKVSKEFYVIEIFVISIAFSNNVHAYLLYQNSAEVIILSAVFVLLMLFSSVVLYTLEKNQNFFKKLAQPCIFLIGGLFMIFSDPEVLSLMSQKKLESICPSLLQIILVTVLQSKSKDPVFIYIISFFLGIFSFCLSFESGAFDKAVYLLIVNSSICLQSVKNLKHPKKSKIFSEKYSIDEIDSDEKLDLAEIIFQLQRSVENLAKINQKFKTKSISKLIRTLQKIWISLKENKNIYITKIENITKDMDIQDKLFIEQSCFTTLANQVVAKKHKPILKENLNFNYGESDLVGVLSQVGKDWNFNTFFISDCSGKEPIQVIGSYTIHRYNLDTHLSITEASIKCFLKKLENSYKENPYHNSTHGADVLCSYLYLVTNSDIFNHMTPIELLAGIIAALGHDAGHPGRTNRFLVLTKDDIAIAYNDISVLEMMHTSIVFNILKTSDCNILTEISAEKWLVIRKCIIDMILATDMSKHFDMMAQFRVKYHETDFINFENSEIRNDLFKLVIKAADIGHAAKSIELHEKWCELVVAEFYAQGDLEKSLGINVSMYCDRETTDISKSQAGFIKNIVYPLFSTLNSILVSEKIEIQCLGQLRNNELYWVSRRKTIRGQSLISQKDEYVNYLNNLKSKRKSIRKQSLPQMLL